MADPGTRAVQESELPDRGVDCLLVYELLHLIEDRRPFFGVELVGLLWKQLVDIGVAAIDKRAAFDDERGQPGRRVAEGSAAPLDDAMVIFLRGIGGEKPARSIGCNFRLIPIAAKLLTATSPTFAYELST